MRANPKPNLNPNPNPDPDPGLQALKKEGYTCKDMRRAGFTLHDLKTGYTSADLKVTRPLLYPSIPASNASTNADSSTPGSTRKRRPSEACSPRLHLRQPLTFALTLTTHQR